MEFSKQMCQGSNRSTKYLLIYDMSIIFVFSEYCCIGKEEERKQSFHAFKLTCWLWNLLVWYITHFHRTQPEIHVSQGTIAKGLIACCVVCIHVLVHALGFQYHLNLFFLWLLPSRHPAAGARPNQAEEPMGGDPSSPRSAAGTAYASTPP